jgi:hypothetical protein
MNTIILIANKKKGISIGSSVSGVTAGSSSRTYKIN